MNVYARMNPEVRTAYFERRFGVAPNKFFLAELKKMVREGLASASVEEVDGENKKVVDIDLEILRIAVGRCEARNPFVAGVRIRLEMDRDAKHFINREARVPYGKLIRAASRLIKSGLLSLTDSVDAIVETVGKKLIVKTDLLMARRLVAVATDGRK